MNHYISVFTESFLSSTIIPFMQSPTFAAMQAFGGFDMRLAALLAIIGSTLGLTLNWYVGRLFLWGFRQGKIALEPKHHAKAAHYYFRYGLWTLLLGWYTIFNYVPVVAGFLGVRLRIALPLMFLGQAGYYGWKLLG